MDTSKINRLIRQFPVEEIEKHIVYIYLDRFKIDYEPCSFISDYLEGLRLNDDILNDMSLTDIASIEDLASFMEMLIPSEDKKVNGAFFTPSYIADFIITGIAPEYDAKVLDPSCGSGAFLLASVKYFMSRHNKTVCESIRNNIFGADILPYNIRRCQLLLSILALSNKEVIEVDDMNLICCDSLKYEWIEKFDAVVGNPPYVKFQDMDDTTRDFLSSNFNTTKFGTFNLYFAFFELGYKLLNESGKLGYITPNNYFTSLSGESLRTFFNNERCVDRIIDFNSTKVFEVQTYTAITFLNRRYNTSILYDRIKNGINPTDFILDIDFSENPYTNLSDKKWRLLCGTERENIAKIEGCGETIGNLFNICVGIATLKDEVYFFTPVAQDGEYYYISRDNNKFAIEKNVTRPVVKISDMKTSDDLDKNNRRIIFPYKSCGNKVVAISEETMASKYPGCYEYFLYVKDILGGRGKGKQIYTPFYAYGRTQGLNRSGIKLLTPTFSKTPRFLFDKNANGFFTNGYGVYIRESQLSLFNGQPISKAGNLDVIQKILNSYIMEYYVDKTSVAIEGGYPCYQKNFIENFSVPELSDNEIEELRSIDEPSLIDQYLLGKYQLNLEIPKRS